MSVFPFIVEKQSQNIPGTAAVFLQTMMSFRGFDHELESRSQTPLDPITSIKSLVKQKRPYSLKALTQCLVPFSGNRVTYVNTYINVRNLRHFTCSFSLSLPPHSKQVFSCKTRNVWFVLLFIITSKSWTDSIRLEKQVCC